MSLRHTREKIVDAADMMFYQRGFDHTSFADISRHVQISRGNFYYHFKTKDDILNAVIMKRLADRQRMMEAWEIEGQTPQARILHFINILLTNGEKIKKHGCPIGTLSTELAKLDHDQKHDANKLFILFRLWLRRQFELMGHSDTADDLALHVLARSQGISVLANAFRDDTFIRREVQGLQDWLAQNTPVAYIN